jgi:hypothetical protein
MFTRKSLISHVVALVLGLLSGLLGRDLTGLQAPAEQAVGEVVDAAAKAAADKAPAAPAPAVEAAPVTPAVEAPAAPAVDAGT